MKGPIALQLFRQEEIRKIERSFVDSEKDNVGARRRLAPFAFEKILVVLFLPPDRREERNVGEKMHCDDGAGAESADLRHHNPPMSAQPRHGGSLGLGSVAANAILCGARS